MISIFAMILPAAPGHDTETEPSYPPYAVLRTLHSAQDLGQFQRPGLMVQFGGLSAASLSYLERSPR